MGAVIIAATLFSPPLPSAYAGSAERLPSPDTPSPSPNNAPERFSQAIAALDRGDLVAAQRLFEQVIALDPSGDKAAAARHHLAQLYSQPKAGTPNTLQPGEPSVPLVPKAEDPGSAQTTSEPPPANRSRLASQYRSVEEEFIGEVGDRVFFSSGNADLGRRAVAIVSAQAVWLKQQARLNASIEGHADEPSLSPQQNEALSEARAVAVRDRLVADGVAPERLSIVAWGRDGRISICAESQCQAQNRRAVTVLVPKNQPVKPPQRQGQVLPQRPPLPTQ